MLRSRKLSPGDYINYAITGFICLACLFPFLYVVSVSLTAPEAYLPLKFILVPPKFSLKAYEYILSASSYSTSLRNTFFVTVVGTVLSLLVTYTGAYGLSKREMPGRKLIVGLISFTLVFNAGIVPNFFLVRSLHLIDNIWSLILPALSSAWNFLVVMSFIQSTIPSELEDAAKIDGCTDIGVFLRIIIPLSGASIATFTLFFAVAYWNQYFNAMLYINSTDRWTLPMLIKSMIIDNELMGYGVGDERVAPQETVKMASIVLSMLPIIVVYPFLQKYFQKGVMLGSVKG